MEFWKLLWSAVKSLFFGAKSDAAPTPVSNVIELLVDGEVVGVAQSMTHAGSHITLSRVRINEENCKKLFNRGHVHNCNQRMPFMLKKGDEFWSNCWMTNIAYTFIAGDWSILENVKVEAEEHLNLHSSENWN